MSVARQRRGARAGATALEFALVAPAFLALLLGIMELGFLLYAQTALDYAARQAARQMQTGRTARSAVGAGTFNTLVFCPYLTPFLDCSGVVVVLRPVSNYRTAMQTSVSFTASSVNAGQTGGLMLLQASYTPALPLWPLNVTRLVGTAAYLNEF
ncbi:putative TadZ/CpaE, associated with Flp pilus assembly [Rhodovastum atsumiense]|uniref:Pilus assembly protein n=1 Tax=Rhodovastum atsumiense TaxID=504468 RepID=A0A5M6IZW8_9PROT|nr:TadE family protein [Rhodovastum atsumiense]KAA5613890.1 pilus assembly protein [Rhodovastum atsumiense]CAH2602016.1 putative TadZ/CpaE, associated with Flp pilus assembly [Rhodovastum atsumiense]